MRDTVSIARVRTFVMNDRLECNSNSRNCPECISMVCGVIKALPGGGRLGLQNEEEINSQGKFHYGERHLMEGEKNEASWLCRGSRRGFEDPGEREEAEGEMKFGENLGRTEALWKGGVTGRRTWK